MVRLDPAETAVKAENVGLAVDHFADFGTLELSNWKVPGTNDDITAVPVTAGQWVVLAGVTGDLEDGGDNNTFMWAKVLLS